MCCGRDSFSTARTRTNKAYGLHAALRGNQQGEDSQSKYVWYVGLSPNFAPATNKVSMMWEFRDFPTNTTNIYLREYFVSKSADGATNTMDFVLPGAAQLSVRIKGVLMLHWFNL